ncbi:MAG: type VI secretion system baseplate subunit TssG, partial [Comamonadaceae bacterium]
MRRDPTVVELGLQDLLLRLREAPWKFGFTSLMRRLAAVHSGQPRIGLASRPQQEPFRLGQTAALIFAPREIAEVVLPGDADAPVVPGAPVPRAGNNAAVPVVRLYGLGLLGPNGPLPLHYTE